MSLVLYNEENIIDFKNNFNNYSKEVCDSFTNIYNEINSINNILSTPKSNKTVPKLIEYYNSEINNLKDSINRFNSDFNMIMREYEKFSSDVKVMVGDNSDE